jgi:uncharacterized repeat protein (TIGR01451 family)
MGIRKHICGWLVLVFTCSAPLLVLSQQLPPFSYYVPATNKTSGVLKSALHEIIKGHTVIPYSSSIFDTHDALAILDRDPSNSANVLLIYSGYSVAASTWPDWNREHIWPQSFGVGTGTPVSDLFNLRACDQGVNSSRGNKYFDVSTGSIGHHPSAPESSYDADSWEPRDADKGYVARAAFYVSTRYDGAGGEPILQLADSPNAGAMIFAKLSTLLDWNRRFPPTDSERSRNGAIYQDYQHNRNPFIDNPDFADMIFLGVDGFAAWQGTHFSVAELSSATIAAADDSDGDGLPNIAEYAFGHDPHVVEGNVIQSLVMQTVDGTNYLYITHHRHHYLSGIALTYQVSTNMTAWDDIVPEVVTNVQIDVVKDLITARFPATGPTQFVRFKVHRLADEPVIVADGAALLAEDCTPSNGLLDPGETVTLTFSLRNVGSASTSNLVVTLLATGGVTSPSAPQNYGVVADGASVARSFTFTAAGDCGGSVTASLQLQDGPVNLGTVTFTFSLGQFVNPHNEEFDTVTAPALPSAWTTAASGAQSNWVTSTAQADTFPNAAFSPDPGNIGVNELVTPSFFISSSSARLMFAHNYSLTASTTNSGIGYDGGVLEIKIGGGSFQDILAAGGSFALGGYNTALSSDFGNPLAGRQAWSGNSLGFVTTIVNLPAAAAGENVQLRWRCGAGSAPVAPFAVVTPLSVVPLAGWDVSGQSGYGTSPLSPTTTGANVAVGGLTRGSGVGTGGTAAGRAWGGNGWVDASAPSAITNDRVATFTIQANPGFKVSFSSISKFDYRRSATGPPNGLLQYQVGAADSFHDIATLSYSSSSSSGASIGATDLSAISALQNVAPGTVITFRIVNWGGGSAGTWYVFDKDNSTASDFEVQGTVTPVPVNDGWYIDSAFIEDAVCCGTSAP